MKCYFGKRGTGKTRACVYQIRKEWLANPDLKVLTNTPMLFGLHPKRKTPLNQYLFGDIEQIQAFIKYANNNQSTVLLAKNKTIIFIDEANLVMPSRLFAKLPPFLLTFLAESRKYNTDIYYTTQDVARVDVILRELTEDFYRTASVGSLITIVVNYVVSKDAIVGERIGWTVFYPKPINGLYDTHYIVGMSEALTALNPSVDEKMWTFIDKTYTEPEFVKIKLNRFSPKRFARNIFLKYKEFRQRYPLRSLVGILLFRKNARNRKSVSVEPVPKFSNCIN